ncbi:MAG: hypothetical protein ACYTXT_26435 [Nostoc sp.]|uniref:Uncharacterized protein n=1 Tax=Nostoc punctiforme NIES-2108 TaxID=1356359 RepID=A0A367RMM0_NOSPU|nr:hypothetical protein A6769_13050 [Nostoc punctiforme NIES-2108]
MQAPLLAEFQEAVNLPIVVSSVDNSPDSLNLCPIFFDPIFSINFQITDLHTRQPANAQITKTFLSTQLALFYPSEKIKYL